MAAAPEPIIAFGAGMGSVVNDEALVNGTVAELRKEFGARVVQIPAITASEDFSTLSEAGIPVMYFFVGGIDPQTIASARSDGRGVIANHSPYFAPVPETSIKTAVQAMAVSVLNALPVTRR